MNTETATPTSANLRKKPTKAPVTPARSFATHEELIADMQHFRQTVSATPGAAKAFLIRAGLLTISGKPKQLIRG